MRSASFRTSQLVGQRTEQIRLGGGEERLAWGVNRAGLRAGLHLLQRFHARAGQRPSVRVAQQDRHHHALDGPVGVAEQLPVLTVGIHEAAVGQHEPLQVLVDPGHVVVQALRRPTAAQGVVQLGAQAERDAGHVVRVDDVVVLQREVVMDVGPRELRGDGAAVDHRLRPLVGRPQERRHGPLLKRRLPAGPPRVVRQQELGHRENAAVPGVFLRLGVESDLVRRGALGDAVCLVGHHAADARPDILGQLVPHVPGPAAELLCPMGRLPGVAPAAIVAGGPRRRSHAWRPGSGSSG